MKITVERDALAMAISAAARAAARKDTIPILSNILIKPNGSTLGLMATDLVMQAETSVSADVSRDDGDDEAITVVAEALSGIVGKMPKGAQVAMEWKAGTGGVTVTHCRSRYKLQTLTANDFPKPYAIKEPVEFEISSKVLRDAIGAVKFAVAREASRAYLQGVFLHAEKDGLYFVATNGADLARVKVALPVGAKNLKPVIIPEAAVTEIAKLAGTEDGNVRMVVSENLVSAEARGHRLTTKLVDGDYPEYTRVIPQAPDRHMIVDCGEMSEVLTRLISVGDGLNTKADLSAGVATFRLHNHLIGDAEEAIGIEWQGEPIVIGIRAQSIATILDLIETERCSMGFTSVKTAVLIHPYRDGAIDESRTYVSMPVL